MVVVGWKREKRQDRKGDLEEGTESGLERTWRQDWKDAVRAWKEGDRKKGFELVSRGSYGSRTIKKGIIFSKRACRG